MLVVGRPDRALAAAESLSGGDPGISVECLDSDAALRRLRVEPYPDAVLISVGRDDPVELRAVERIEAQVSLMAIPTVVLADEEQALPSLSIDWGAYLVEPDPRSGGRMAALALRLLEA